MNTFDVGCNGEPTIADDADALLKNLQANNDGLQKIAVALVFGFNDVLTANEAALKKIVGKLKTVVANSLNRSDAALTTVQEPLAEQVYHTLSDVGVSMSILKAQDVIASGYDKARSREAPLAPTPGSALLGESYPGTNPFSGLPLPNPSDIRPSELPFIPVKVSANSFGERVSDTLPIGAAQPIGAIPAEKRHIIITIPPESIRPGEPLKIEITLNINQFAYESGRGNEPGPAPLGGDDSAIESMAAPPGVETGAGGLRYADVGPEPDDIEALPDEGL